MAIDPFAAIRKVELDRDASTFEPGAEAVPAQAAPPDTPEPVDRAQQWRDRTAGIIAETDLSREWAEGLAAIELMPMPTDARPERWAQIVADAISLMGRWGDELTKRGWTLSDVFGFDPEGDADSLGLLFSIRGGRVVLVDDRSAIIRFSNHSVVFNRGRCAGAEPVWTLRRRK